LASRTSNLVALAVATVLTLAACEVALRWLLPAPPLVDVAGRRGADVSVTAAPGSSREVSDLYLQTDKGLRLRPGAELTISSYPIGGRTVEISTDELGMRRIARVPAGGAGKLRVLFVGDSVTFGEGVSDGETFSQLLEGRLLPDGRRIEAFNGGVPGYGTANEVELFADIRETTRPDVAVLVFYLNDAIPSPAVRVFSPPSWLAGSYLAGRLCVVASRIAGGLAPTGRFMPDQALVEGWQREVLAARDDPSRALAAKNLADWGVAWSDGVWSWIEPYLARFVSLAREGGGLPVLIVTPLEAQLDSARLDDRPQRRIHEIGAKLGVPVIDVLPALREAASGKSEGLYLDHCHFSPAGHRVVADAIASGLAAMPRPGSPAAASSRD
jgi:lysophospholipase L1-like esterase